MKRAVVRCVVADASPLVVAGLRAVLVDQGFGMPVGEADQPRRVVEVTRQTRPDLLLCGLGPLAATFSVAKQVAPIPVLALVWTCTRAEAAEAINAGLGGLALKGAPVAHLGTAIAAVMGGATPVPRAASYEAPIEARTFQRLTSREEAVVQLVSTGLSNTQVAARLGIAPQTVKNHLRSAMSKLGAHSRVEVCLWTGQRSAMEFA